MRRYLSDSEWVGDRVAGLPPRWRRRLTRAWERRSPCDYVGANVELREATASLLSVRVPLDASDAEICDEAEQLARRCMERLSITGSVQEARASMERVCAGQSIAAPPPETAHGPAIARMSCPLWWRRRLRKHQGRTVEAAAVRLGYVNRFRDLYVSNERLAARLQQNKRNAAALEATTARNEDGQVFTLAELAEKSTANKAIRRAELMTRIAGFERYADTEGHQGLLITITCPSRFHPFLIVNDGKAAVPNPKHDPRESPRTAHDYLTRCWARSRAALKRLKICPYGFRISEPQHDGTPHWHLLVFCPAEQTDELMAVLRRYAMADSGDESGAAQHRCDFKLIDKSKGTAAGYIAKYVSKNIDGEHVGDDLEGHPAKESAKRVEAWAATWGIRQFQQVGGPPVSVWRELRRVRTLPADAPQHLIQAHRAANKQMQRDGDDTATVAWEDYCRAQGGTTCGRKAAIKLAMRKAEGCGRYGDAGVPRPFGVQTNGVAALVSNTSPVDEPVTRSWLVESERRIWIIEHAPAGRSDRVKASAAAAEPLQPWTRVNNCTGMRSTAEPTPATEQPGGHSATDCRPVYSRQSGAAKFGGCGCQFAVAKSSSTFRQPVEAGPGEVAHPKTDTQRLS